ncbi:VWA domain-containing protein [Patescibacteria group bacterium]|nr:VWA domain-containing protein [Patescibacteria group bacterium]MCG2809257.1 VWA domain-containing protein [Candidatus Portnoybacteria bacterium]
MKNNFEQFNKQNVDRDEDKESFGEEEKPKQKEEFSEELKEYQKEGQEMIDSYRKFFMTFAKDVSLDFKMSDGFYINLENGEVNLDTKWFAEKGFSKEQILWANLHELAHFRDLAGDPERMMKNFDYIKKQAKKTGAIMIDKWEKTCGASDPEFIENLKRQKPISKKDPSQTMNAVEQAAYKIHHTFYNIFDDIYVNNLVARKAPKYEKEEKGGEEIEKLYSEKLFAKTDYSKLPRHLQFLYKLIREEMVPGEKVVLSDEVAEVVEQKMKFQGKEYSPKKIVDELIKPKGDRDTKAGQRYFVLQKTMEPIFEELLAKDLEEWEPKKPEEKKGEGGESPANPFEQDYKEHEENNPSQISDEEIEGWMEKKEEDKEEKEEREAKEKEEESKSAEEKAGESQEKMDKSWREKHNISQETLQQYRKIEAEVAPYLEDLSKLWQRIIFGSTKKIERGMEGHFKDGTELDIQKTIEQWPQIQKGELEETRIFKKMTRKEILIRRPELIRLRLVGDMSGSMDEKKKHILQQSFVLLLSSFREFNTYLNLTRSQTKSKLEADTEAWVFGDNAERIKKLRSESGYDDEQVETIKIFEKLERTLGGTYDNKALEAIFESLTPEDKERIGQEKIMEIIFEITDGGSLAPDAARNAVDKITELGVIARAFQIGDVDESEKETFNKVWNKNREEKLGEIVGEKIENLLPAITELLKKYMNNVRL